MAIVTRYKLKKPGKVKILLFALILLGAVVAGTKYYRWFLQPNLQLGSQAVDYLYIPTGSDLEDVVQLLTYQRWLKNEKSFTSVARLFGYDKMVKAGRYKVSQGMNNYHLVSLLRRGAQSPVQLTFNNVRTLPQLAGIVSRKIEADSVSVLQVLNNDSLILSMGFNPETLPALFIPDTYEFFWNTSSSQWLQRMHKEHGRFWNAARMQKADSLGLTPIEVSTLASIVDEETIKGDEKPVVAGLYLNRLKINMPLQADPTVKFALGDFAIRRILKKDLGVDSPYNTYRHAGLPPGPIRIPSVGGIDAVLNAQPHRYLYMCAKDDFSGYHNFAVTLNQHQQNAAKYQRALRKAGIFR
ncbi:MAG: endolytic transglycosylase MltG [Breznakibacter sp.]|nr:endolytic transglycosylase MltG [Breznakibacter sp.]